METTNMQEQDARSPENARLKTALEIIDRQRAQLPEILNRYATPYDAIFDRQSALQSVLRWGKRTAQQLAEHVSNDEGLQLLQLLQRSFPLTNRRLREYLGSLDTFLEELADDIAGHPEQYPSPSEATPRRTSSADPVKSEYDVFLSYSSRDKDEAREIVDLIQQVGKKWFLSEKSLKPGDMFQDQIRDALACSKQVWILVSPHSIESDWVQREIWAAWALKKRIVPILLSCTSAALPSHLSGIHAIEYHKVTSLVSDLGSA